MRTKSTALMLLTLAPSLVQAQQSAPESSHVKRFEDVEFRALNPAMSPGAQAAILWGDPATGPSSVLFKMGRGATPLHTHTSTYHLVVVQGTMKHWVRGESEKDALALGPGSFWYIEGGKPHADSCLTDECVAFIRWDGKRDGQLLESR